MCNPPARQSSPELAQGWPPLVVQALQEPPVSHPILMIHWLDLSGQARHSHQWPGTTSWMEWKRHRGIIWWKQYPLRYNMLTKKVFAFIKRHCNQTWHTFTESRWWWHTKNITIDVVFYHFPITFMYINLFELENPENSYWPSLSVSTLALLLIPDPENGPDRNPDQWPLDSQTEETSVHGSHCSYCSSEMQN